MGTFISRNSLERVSGSSFDFSNATTYPIMINLMIYANFYRFVCNKKSFSRYFFIISPCLPHHTQKHKLNKNKNLEIKTAKCRERLQNHFKSLAKFALTKFH